jgi:LysW-gamma-L-lysine/LysW-L-ornithine aminotransferase
LLAEVSRLGHRFVARLREEAGDEAAVRGMGLMAGVSVGERRDEVLKALQRQGVLAIPAGADVVRFLPPYVVSEGDLDRAAALLGDAARGARKVAR